MATTIQVSDETWSTLNERKERDESFDEVIQDLIQESVQSA